MNTLPQRILFLLACGILFPAVSARSEEDFAFFEQNIRPVLVEHCYKCHSASSEKIKGGLLLDTKAGLLKGGDSGPAIVPGKPEESLLIAAVRYGDRELQMPPKTGKLPEKVINDLVAWVKMGAPDPRSETLADAVVKSPAPSYDFAAARTNWAFGKPNDPTPPIVSDKRWPKSPIDQFILSRLEEKRLRPSREADKRVLIRRATYDLTGLPPSTKQIDDFLADNSPGAFARVVDRLLASPQYGERWARHWLDVVRYTDSLDGRVVGTEQDSLDAWRYRDWVVKAFNDDLPYNKFIAEQVAGDVLQPSNPDEIDTNAIIATGMYAIGNWGNGDADKDKILTDIADDAVDVTGRAFLGLTLACARCHDHKFDPIPTADYYSMAGIFFSSHILPKLTPKGAGEILMRIPLISKGEAERRKQRDLRIVELKKEIEETEDKAVAQFAMNVKSNAARYLMASAKCIQNPGLDIRAVASNRGLREKILKRWVDYLDGGQAGILSQPVRDLLGNASLSAWRNDAGADTPSVVANSSDKEVSFLTIKLPAHKLAIHPSPNEGVAAVWKSPISGRIQMTGKVADVDPNCGNGVDWEIRFTGAPDRKAVASGTIPNGGAQDITGKETPVAFEVNRGDSIQFIVYPKSEYSCDSTMIEWEIEQTDGDHLKWNLDRDVAPDLLAGDPHPDSHGNAGVWSFVDLSRKALAAPGGTGFADWLDAMKHASEGNEPALEAIATRIQSELLGAGMTNGMYAAFATPQAAFWSPFRHEPEIYAVDDQAKMTTWRRELASLQENPPPPIAMTHGLQEGGVPESPHAGIHDVKIHIRGKYDRLGELVPRRFPRILAGDAQKPIMEGSGRRELAEWLGSTGNPLAARVMVNRIWQHHFGEGIVRTPNNFGKLGTPPTHPELLDYLARRFVDSGWSIKAMHRAIMLSATYQQSSDPDPETMRADPDNLLFGRMNRARLDAESLRDSLLSAAGNLDLSIGGPAIRDLNNRRRTLYLMTIRSDRSNYRSLFDAADSTAIVDKRESSTVAPQALFLMNNPFALDQAKALAGRVVALDKPKDQDRIEWLYDNLYGRLPEKREVEIGKQLVESARRAGQAGGDMWLEYCQALLCANEFIYID